MNRTILDKVISGELTQAEAARMCGVSRQAINQALNKMHPGGRLSCLSKRRAQEAKRADGEDHSR